MLPHVKLYNFPGAVRSGRGDICQSLQMCTIWRHYTRCHQSVKKDPSLPRRCKSRGENRQLSVSVLTPAPWPCDLSDCKYVFPQLKNLAKLKILDHDKCNIIRIHGAFFARGHHCMVFEHLDRSLGDLMRELPFSRLHLNQIRLIVWQVSTFILCLITINVT